MKVYLDTNVILDYLLKRTENGFGFEVKEIFDLIEEGSLVAYAASASFFTLDFFISRKYQGGQRDEFLLLLLAYLHPIETSKENLLAGVESDFKDKEDAFQYFTAKNTDSIQYFITGNIKDYRSVSMDDQMRVVTPKQFLEVYYESKSN